jgi:hypothetical protein
MHDTPVTRREGAETLAAGLSLRVNREAHRPQARRTTPAVVHHWTVMAQ